MPCTPRHVSFAHAALAAAALLAAACAGGGATLTVAAASDLAAVLGELAPAIEAACDVQVVTTLGSSGQLRDQVRAGAPYDLFLSADRAFPRDLEAAGVIEAGSVREYAAGHIAIAWRDGLPPATSLEDLRRPDVRRIAIANPGHAPYGRAAREALEAAGLWEVLQPRLVVAENVRQALEYVRTGNADAGIVARSLLTDPERPYAPISDALHTPIVQSGGVVAGAKQAEAARCALVVMTGAEGRRMFTRYGYGPVE